MKREKSLFVSLGTLPLVVTALPASDESAPRATLPRYDAAIRATHLAARANAATTAPAVTPKPRPRLKPVAEPVEVEGFIELPKMTINELKPAEKPVKSLPRVVEPGVVKDVPDGDEFESRNARNERLIDKHFTKFEQALDRLIPRFGRPSLASQAANKENALAKARTLNRLADTIELGELLGSDPEQTRKLRHEFLRLYYAGPTKEYTQRDTR